MRYRADITAGSLKVPESRIIADLLLRDLDESAWHAALYEENVLQARSPKTISRLTLLLRGRLETMDAELWRMVRDGDLVTSTHACMAAAIKHSALLGDFLDIALRDQYRLMSEVLRPSVWSHYVDSCHDRDPEMPAWAESTVDRLRSTVFQILAQVGYVDGSRTLRLQAAQISREVLAYLQSRNEDYVLRCIKVGP